MMWWSPYLSFLGSYERVYPVSTRRCFNVKTTSCAYWVRSNFHESVWFKYHLFSKSMKLRPKTNIFKDEYGNTTICRILHLFHHGKFGHRTKYRFALQVCLAASLVHALSSVSNMARGSDRSKGN